MVGLEPKQSNIGQIVTNVTELRTNGRASICRVPQTVKSEGLRRVCLGVHCDECIYSKFNTTQINDLIDLSKHLD